MLDALERGPSRIPKNINGLIAQALKKTDAFD